MGIPLITPDSPLVLVSSHNSFDSAVTPVDHGCLQSTCYFCLPSSRPSLELVFTKLPTTSLNPKAGLRNIFAYAYVYGWVHACLCVVCVETQGWCQASSSITSYYIFGDRVSWWTQSSPIALDSPYLCLLRRKGYKQRPQLPNFYEGSGHLNFRPHTCEASDSCAKTSPSAPGMYLNYYNGWNPLKP